MSVKDILAIVPYKVLPANFGGEKCVTQFYQYLGQLVNLTAVSTKANKIELARNYRMLNIFSNSRIRYANPFLYFKLKKLLRETGATQVLIEHPYYGWLAWLLKISLNVKWVIHSHNIEYMRSRSIGRKWWPALKWYEQWTYRKADLIFFISEDDQRHAIEVMGINSSKTEAITYGIEIKSLPDDLSDAKKTIRAKHGIADDERILLFNGALFHHSNYDAVTIITEQINPFLLKHNLRYKILICGKGLPDHFEGLKAYGDKNIIHAGFVEDISLYFKSADIFLNPIESGAGIKTKAIEALSANNTVVSTELGALGIKREVCGKKLHVVNDGDWDAFNKALLNVFHENELLPDSFFDYYYWGNIALKAKKAMDQL